jgi:hypothetical protein
MSSVNKYLYAMSVALLLLAGCATFQSSLHGSYSGEAGRNLTSKPVKVLFHFTHVEQTIGYDAIPKIVGKSSMIRSFDDVFHDALREFGNLGEYATFTEEASDVNRPDRRVMCDSLISQCDYTVKVRIVAEHRFIPYFFGGLATTVSATLIPIPYRQSYRMETEVFARDGKLVNTYHRQAYLSKWVEMFLVVAYPFCPEDRKREEIFMAMLHDTFRQIESEQILSTQ